MCKGIAKPFLKWAGGKGQLLEKLNAYYPNELINGEIIYMSPRLKTNHIKVSGAIFRIFSNYLRKKPFGLD